MLKGRVSRDFRGLQIRLGLYSLIYTKKNISEQSENNAPLRTYEQGWKLLEAGAHVERGGNC